MTNENDRHRRVATLLKVDLENCKRHLAELTEQLRLANIDAFNAEAKLAAIREYLDQTNDISPEILADTIRIILDHNGK